MNVQHSVRPAGAVTAKGYASETGSVYIPVRPAQQLQIRPFPRKPFAPIRTYNKYSLRHYEDGLYNFPENFVLMAPDARIAGSDGVVITADDRVIQETCLLFHEEKLLNHWVFHSPRLPDPTPYEGTLATVAISSPENYFHWMCDLLPKLEILRLSQVHYDTIYLPMVTKPFQQETLALMEIAPEMCVFADSHTHLEARQLAVVSLPALPTDVPLWVVQFLRKTFLTEQPKAVNRRVYISRRIANRRKLVNEEEIVSALVGHGFEEIFLENLSTEDQAELFASSSIIIGPHGAGLTNLVFASPSAKVIELYHPYWICECFWEISRQMGLEHRVIIGETVASDPSSYQIDLKELISQLRQVQQ